MLTRINYAIARLLIPYLNQTDNHAVRVRHGAVAGWIALVVSLILFAVKLVLAFNADSVAVFANAFHLLSDFANSVILLASFHVAARPATTTTPFGHGRMEHVAPLVMAIVLFICGIQLGEKALQQVITPREIHYFPALPWVLGITIVVKEFVGQFIRYLGKRVSSTAILTNASHHRIEAILSGAVIAGVLAGHHYHLPRIDGYMGIFAALWLLYLGFDHGKHAIAPILGEAPSRELTERIRNMACSIEGVEDAHEIIVHDYGSKYLISLHAEIPEKYGPARMHEIAEECEEKLRKEYSGEAVCHTDPLMEKTEEVQEIEKIFRTVVQEYDKVTDYHDFRVIADSENQIILAADIDADENVDESTFPDVTGELETRAKQAIPNVAYCSFYITPKFAY